MIQLIEERRALRHLLQRLALAKATDAAAVTKVERQLEALVADPLELDAYEQPNRSQLPVVARAVLFKTTTTFELLDRPELVFDRLGCGVDTQSWVPKLKKRLLDLAGPFENVAARIAEQAAADA